MPRLWQDGFWVGGNPFNRLVRSACIIEVSGKQIYYRNMVELDYPNIKMSSKIQMEEGDFGPTIQDIKEVSGGICSYNMRFIMVKQNAFAQTGHVKGVVNPSGDKIWFVGASNSIEMIKKLSDAEFEMKRSSRDHKDTPTCSHITPKPGAPGKIYWLSGPPGAGKSTICQLMARERGFRYFEADCVMHFVNPFIDLHQENPSIAQIHAKPLKGFCQGDAQDILTFTDLLFSGQTDDHELERTGGVLLKVMGREVNIQRNRLGGDFAVAFAVSDRKSRDFLRAEVGSNLVYLVLNLTKKCQTQRIEARHPGEDNQGLRNMLIQMHEQFAPADEDEADTFNVEIDEHMTPKDVMNSILRIIEKS